MVQPRPRNTKCSKATGSKGRGSVSARSASAIAGLRSSPNEARNRASVVVAKRVWTTDCSSADSRRMLLPAASTTGESRTAEMATVGVPGGTARRARTISVVVPEREMTTTAS
jgi:hypothetical protein